MQSEEGQEFVRNLAYFVRTHERALANALQLQRQHHKNAPSASASSPSASSTALSRSISLAEAVSRPPVRFSSQSVKPAKLTLTPHHLYFLLSKFEDLGVDVGLLNVRLENLHSDAVPSNYVSFLGHAPKSRGKQSDADSMHSVSSVRSMISSVTSLWSTLTLSNGAARAEKQIVQYRDDIKYLYSCFTKIPALRLSSDLRARLIAGYEEFPFDTAVPLFVFKNVSSLEVCELDFRQFYGWDRLAEQLRSLTLKRAHIDDPIELLQNIVLDDMEKRRKRSSKTAPPTTPSTPGAPWPIGSPRMRFAELSRSVSSPNSPLLEQRRASSGSPQALGLARGAFADGVQQPTDRLRQRSTSPARPPSSRHGSSHQSRRSGASVYNTRRSSGSSGSEGYEDTPRHSTTNLLADVMSNKWRFLRHLSLTENGLTYLSVESLKPVSETLQSLDLSGNLFTEVPDALASLSNLRALNLSNCMIDSLQSLARSPLPAITTLNLRSNRLLSLAGIERVLTLERVDLRDNKLHDPTELARLNGMLDIVDVYVIKNPFTRTHSNYRVMIFNAFRATPGRTDDVHIDTTGPTNTERRMLNDRVPEPAPKPVMPPPLEDAHDPHDTQDTTAGAGMPQTELPPPALEQPEIPIYARTHRRHISDLGPQSARRRKRAPRRRIVELSQAELASANRTEEEPRLAPSTPTDRLEPTTPGSAPYHTAPTTQAQLTEHKHRPVLETAFESPTPPPRIRDPSDDDEEDHEPAQAPQNVVDSSTDLYRQKIEALKSELGPNWLTALNEDRLAEQRTRHRSFSPTSRTSTIRPERLDRGVSVGGRTLG